MTDTHAADLTKTDSGASKRTPKEIVHITLPWAVLALGFVSVNHAADTQTLVTAAAAGDTDAVASARWLWLTPPAACAAAIATAFFTNFNHRIIAAVAASVIVPLLAVIAPMALLPLLALPLAAFISKFIYATKGSEASAAQLYNLFCASALTYIIAFAAYKRQEMLFLMINQPPDPDFGGYLKLAEESSGWATLFREPFYIWTLKFVDVLGGELDPIMQRLTSIATGLGAVAAIFYLCMRHLNVIVAVIASALYAGQEYLVYTSCRGLREDSIVLTTFLFIAVSWNHLRGAVTWKSLTLWGLLAAASSLLRISSLSFCLVTIAGVGLFRFFRDIKPWPQRTRWLLPLALPIVLMTPYLVHLQREYGDPLFVVKYHVRFYANQEFGGKHPDFPTAEEIAKDSYAGAPMGGGEYIFGYHEPPEIIKRTWRGFEKTFFMENLNVSFAVRDTSTFKNLISILNVIGVLLLLLPRNIFLLITMFVFHAPLFFLASFPYFDPRLLVVAMAFIYISVASSVGLSIYYAFKYLRATPDENRAYGRSKTAPDKTRKTLRHRKHPHTR